MEQGWSFMAVITLCMIGVGIDSPLWVLVTFIVGSTYLVIRGKKKGWKWPKRPQKEKRNVMNREIKDILWVIGNTLVDIAIVGGIVYLASKNQEGWGWLVFIMLFRKW